MMNIWFDVLGLTGTFLIILSFCLVQSGRTSSFSAFYLYSNFLGSVFLLISLCYDWNLASVAMQILWMSISVYGLIKHRWLKPKSLAEVKS